MHYIRLIKCERGQRPAHLPGNPAEWEADFCLLLSHAPDNAWREIFDDLRRRDYQTGLLTSFFTAHVEDDRFSFFCRPLHLQAYVDRIAALVEESNQLYRRNLGASEWGLDETAIFEESIDDALNSLHLPTQDDIAYEHGN